METNKKIISILPLLAASFLDYLNIVVALIVFPVLLVHPTHSIIPSFSPVTKTMMVGFLLTIFYIGQFLSEPIWGNLSDRYGRKKLICVALMGTLLSLLLTALAIEYKNIVLLFVSRGISGLFAASIAITQSSMADMSTNSKSKVGYLSMVEMAIGLGLALGGVAGGTLTDNSIVSWFTLSTPFLTLSFLNFLTLLVIITSFKETLHIQKKGNFSLFACFNHIIKAFKNLRLRTMFMVWACFILGWTFYSQFFPLFLLNKFHYSFAQIGNTFIYGGLLYLFIQLLLVKPFAQRIAPQKVVLFMLPFVGLPSIAILFPTISWGIVSLMVFYLVAIAFVTPNIVAVISNLVDDAAQGEAMGMIWAIQACMMVFGTFAGSFLTALNPALPLVSAGCLIILSWFIYIRCYF